MDAVLRVAGAVGLLSALCEPKVFRVSGMSQDASANSSAKFAEQTGDCGPEILNLTQVELMYSLQ